MQQSEADCLSRLSDQLREDADADVPPWASSAVALAPQCGARAEPWIRAQVASGSRSSFLALEALRLHFPHAWAAISPEDRAATYARHLAGAHWFNAWGQPEEAPSDTGQALIALGPAAIPALAPLLESRRPAPSYGSEEATISRLLAYRVCDYAWMFITRIEAGNAARLRLPFPPSADQRDPAIAAMRARLPNQ